jgi:hypothetical protein
MTRTPSLAGAFRTLPAILATVLALALPAAASATEPTHQTQQLTRDLGVIGRCAGFDVAAIFFPTRTVTTFFNKDGLPIRRMVHAEVPGVITNAATGASLPAFGVRNISVDLITGETASTGTNVHVVVPGQGTVDIGAGRVVIDASGDVVQAAGRLDGAITPELCAALA